MRIAVVCSAHGFGHVTRQLVVADALEARGATVTIHSAAPPALVGARAHVPWCADVGIAQRDSLTEDLDATRALLAERVTDARIDALAARLAAYDGVVVDIAPPALEAARRAGRPAVAVGNFDWAWVYRHYPALSEWAARYSDWQAPHPALALAPGPGLSGFARVEGFGVVGRVVARPGAGRGDPSVRGALRGARPPPPEPTPEKQVLVCFGGLGLEEIDAWLPRLDGVRYVLAPPMRALERPDARYVADVPFPELVARADVVLTKPGYGILAEAVLAGTPVVWVDRGVFPEASHLEAVLFERGDRKVRGRGAEAVAEALRARLAEPRPPPVESDAAGAVAGRILELLR